MTCEYSPAILHTPENMTGPVAEVNGLLNSQLRLELNDERTIIGIFTAFDKFGNFVLTTATEYFRDQTRKMQMVIVPLNFVVKVSSRPAPPPEPEKTDADSVDADENS